MPQLVRDAERPGNEGSFPGRFRTVFDEERLLGGRGLLGCLGLSGFGRSLSRSFGRLS
jgi:hypothetical protein